MLLITFGHPNSIVSVVKFIYASPAPENIRKYCADGQIICFPLLLAPFDL